MCIDRHSRIALALVASALAVYPFASASSATLTKDNAEVVVAANAAPVVKFASEEMTNFLYGFSDLENLGRIVFK